MSHRYCLCTKLNWEILISNSSTVIGDMSKYLTTVCTHACEQTHKPSADHEIAFTCLTILIYLTLRTHKSFMAHISSDVRIPPVECCAETTEPTHTQTHIQGTQHELPDIKHSPFGQRFLWAKCHTVNPFVYLRGQFCIPESHIMYSLPVIVCMHLRCVKEHDGACNWLTC